MEKLSVTICEENKKIEEINGYQLLAYSVRKMAETGIIDPKEAEKKARIYDFLAGCDDEDFNIMVESTAFNEIIRAYSWKAMTDAGIDNDKINEVLKEFKWVFEEYTEKYIIKAYYDRQL